MSDNDNRLAPSVWCWMLRPEEATAERIKQTLQFARCSQLFVAVHSDLPIEPTLSSLYATATRVAPDLDLRVLISKLPPPHAFAFKGRFDGDIWEEKREGEGRFEKTAVAGCFDRLHNGHKVLLSRAALISTGQVVVGVADGELNSRKFLRELIQPSIVRVNAVREFLESITNLPVSIRIMTHPFLPALTSNDVQAMVVSEESKKQGEQFNAMRVYRRLDPLYVEVVPALGGEDTTGHKLSSSTRNRSKNMHRLLSEQWERMQFDRKLSSSARRRELLGRLLKPTNKTTKLAPYTIGLTGGPACGKSTIGVDLRMMGYNVLECEQEFERLCASLSEKPRYATPTFIVSQCLLSSPLAPLLHETWTVIAGRTEMEKRRGTREEEDKSAHAARLAAAHVVLSTDGDRDETRRQVLLAVDGMEKRRKERRGDWRQREMMMGRE